jgi:5'-nucleotidase
LFVAQLVKEVGQKGLKPGIFLNVNIPALPKDKIKGVKITNQDLRSSIELYEKRTDAEGGVYYWPGYKRLEPENEKTDIGALRNGYISITPFLFDQTAHAELKNMESWTITKWKE